MKHIYFGRASVVEEPMKTSSRRLQQVWLSEIITSRILGKDY